MDRAHTRGQPTAVTAVRSMVAGSPPHAVLFAGPPGVGKTTLALDLAAGLLCRPVDGAERPCRDCRACRMVEHGNHPDLHRLGPVGPGGQVVIGGSDAKFRGVRDLVAELALLPVEGGARVAIIERADRMNEDAQSALLKTLEEPPPGVTIVLCADEEERLLPTVRSRCARVRLGPVGPREIEAILGAHDAADAPTAARLGRLASGRPGLAMAYARAPHSLLIRAELARALLDMLGQRPATRLEALRTLVPRAAELVAALEAPVASPDGGEKPKRGAGRSRSPAIRPQPGVTDADGVTDGAPDALVDDEPARRAPAAERRRGVGVLIAIWTDLTRDLLLAGLGSASAIRDVALLDELQAVAGDLPPADLAAFLGRLGLAGERLEANVTPELVLDTLVLDWPRRPAAA